MSLTALPQPPPSRAIPELSSHCPQRACMEVLSSSALLPLVVPTLTGCLQLWSGVLFWPTASSAGSKRGRRWCGGEVPVTSRHCSAQHWEVTLPSAPLPTNTWAPHWGKTKAYKPQQQNLVLVEMRFDFFRACALLHL